MSLYRVVVFLLIPAAPLLAQLANNTVTVTASQSSTAQPDEAVFSVTVGSRVDKSLDDVVAAVSGLGITAANLVQITSPFPANSSPVPLPTNAPAPSLGWTFQLAVPFSKTKDTTAALAVLQKSISQDNSGLSLSFFLWGTRVSGQQTSYCNLEDLVAQARAQAQQAARAAGLSAGAIVGLTSATSAPAPVVCSLTARYALGTMFGQPGPNTITITATRTNNIQPDQVLVGLSVTSGTTAGLDDITIALTDAGITGAGLASVYTTTVDATSGGFPTRQAALVWLFTLTAPLAKLSATLTQVISAQHTISVKNSGLTLSFHVEGMQVSKQLQQSQACSQAPLLADAQAQAKQVANAAGVSAGPILSIATPGAVYARSTLFNLTCSLTVQFQRM
jgi:uncharacterized protein YggE